MVEAVMWWGYWTSFAASLVRTGWQNRETAALMCPSSFSILSLTIYFSKNNDINNILIMTLIAGAHLLSNFLRSGGRCWVQDTYHRTMVTCLLIIMYVPNLMALV